MLILQFSTKLVPEFQAPPVLDIPASFWSLKGMD